MNEQIKQIAERLAGLRDALEITPEEMAKVCNLTPEQYMKLESGTVDISVSVLHQISQAYGVELTTLMFGDEPKMSSYFITRKGKGIAVERTKAYKYQSLAAGFVGRKADPFMVTVHPAPDGTPIYLNSHPGQEYNMVLKGRMFITDQQQRADTGRRRQYLFQLRTAAWNEGTRWRKGQFPGNNPIN